MKFLMPRTTVIMLGLLLGGSGSTDVPSGQKGNVTTLDDQFVRIGEQVPGFGGMFYDEKGLLNVYIKATETELRGPALRPLKSRVAAAITSVMGKWVFDQTPAAAAPAAKTPSDLGEKINILKGDFVIAELARWRKSVDMVLDMEGVVFTDLDEKRNRVRVGIEPSAQRAAIEARIKALGVPADALIIEETQPDRLLASLRDKRRPVPGGFQIEADTGVFANKKCTMGFNAVRNGISGFVTNSHCTEARGTSNGTDFHQPDDPVFSESNKIGDEDFDPPYFTGGDCPPGRKCRFSDSAFIDYTVGRGEGVARTTNDNGSRTLDNANPTFRIVSETPQPVAGLILNKVGRTTGWTFGRVEGTCRNINVTGTDFRHLCQGVVEKITDNELVGKGDSGSPVFQRLSNANEVSLHGILWGSPDDGSRFDFSPMKFVQQELGPLTTFGFPPPPPSGCPSGRPICCDPPDCQECVPQNSQCQ